MPEVDAVEEPDGGDRWPATGGSAPTPDDSTGAA